MSRKKKPSKASAAPPAAKKTVLREQAEAALGASRYREAIEHYKELLKQERRPAWLEGLAAAYAGRAEQLAQKGMINEALALWRTRADMCGTPLIEGPYVGWLLKAGGGEQALRLLAGATQKLSPDAQTQLETQVAAAVLVAPDSALTRLAADSPSCAIGPRPGRRLLRLPGAMTPPWPNTCRRSLSAPPIVTCGLSSRRSRYTGPTLGKPTSR